MEKWKTISKEIALRSQHLTVIKADVEMPSGESTEYFYTDSPGTVMVIPIRMGKDISEHRYVMVRQYRYPVGSYDLEFPAGKREPGEAILDAAMRELRQETGYTAKDIKILYSMYSNPGGSNGTTSICLAVLDDRPQEQDLDEAELQSDLKVEELSAEDLHKTVLSMGIGDPHTLAAICSFVMNSKIATLYLGSKEDNR
jgi:ADP-ribose pyrophosphatase